MIAKMRKVTALCAERDRDALVQILFDAGVVHVASVPTESGAQELQDAKAALDRLDQAISVLSSFVASKATQSPAVDRQVRGDESAIADRVRSLAAARADLDRQLAVLAAEETALVYL